MAHNPASRLDRVLTACAAVAVVAATATVSVASLAHKKTDYQAGDRFAIVRGLDPSRSSSTVVAFVRTNCAHCIESGESLRRMSVGQRDFQFIVVGYEQLEILKSFVRTEGIQADAVVTMEQGSVLFSGVPRVAVLDRNGIVRFVWSGSLEINASVAEVLAAAGNLEKRKTVGQR